MKRCSILWIAIAAVLCRTNLVAARDTETARGVLVEEVRNDSPDFFVRVDVDRAERVYEGGDLMRVSVVSAREGHLYLLYCDAAGQVSCLFPNAFGQDNRIAAKRPIIIPRPAQPNQPSFRLRVGPPYGRELMKAIVTETPLDAEALGRVMAGATSRDRVNGIRAVYVEQELDARTWAEHHVEITTRQPRNSVPASNGGGGPSTGGNENGGDTRASRRVGVFIGVSQYRDESIRDLAVCAKDASAMSDVMQQRGNLQQRWTLLDEKATRQNIEFVLRQQVRDATRPGDSVLIYWSGHGSRCADDGGDEEDGLDEYLVPHDGSLESLSAIQASMITDDTFGRWVQELDGRRVVVVLDMCHSGGQAAGAKALPIVQPPQKQATFDFLSGELARIKDIGQRDTALLASSAASQQSFERREGDLSTMTYFLIRQLVQANGPVALGDGFEKLKRDVGEYVAREFPGAIQTPILVDHLSSPFLLRP